MSNVHLEVHDLDLTTELRRLSDGPDQRHLLALDAAHTQTFYETQAVVHRNSGNLARTGRPHTAYRRSTQEWQGDITYGGRGVDYAYYEYERGREEPAHDFLAPAKVRDSLGRGTAADGRLTDAIVDFLRGGL